MTTLGGALESSTLTLLLIPLAVGIPVGYVILGVIWLNEKTGVQSFIYRNWELVAGRDWEVISGQNGPSPIFSGADVACHDYGTGALFYVGGLLYYVTMIVLLIGMGILAVATFIGFPLSIIMGAPYTLLGVVSRDREMISEGAIFMAMGYGLIVATGLLIRFLMFASIYAPCA